MESGDVERDIVDKEKEAYTEREKAGMLCKYHCVEILC
jgi:hypothetical protein